MKRLRSERLVLEPVTPKNAAILWKIMQSRSLREFQDVPRHTREEFGRRVAARPRHFDGHAVGRFEWLIVLAETALAIGWASLRVADRNGGTAEIGYSVLATYRGAGYASEAARTVIAHAFEDSDVRQIDACCVPANVASRKLLGNVGFAEIRIQRNGAIVRGRPVDIVIFELTRERWRAYAAREAALQRTQHNGEARADSSVAAAD